MKYMAKPFPTVSIQRDLTQPHYRFGWKYPGSLVNIQKVQHSSIQKYGSTWLSPPKD